MLVGVGIGSWRLVGRRSGCRRQCDPAGWNDALNAVGGRCNGWIVDLRPFCRLVVLVRCLDSFAGRRSDFDVYVRLLLTDWLSLAAKIDGGLGGIGHCDGGVTVGSCRFALIVFDGGLRTIGSLALGRRGRGLVGRLRALVKQALERRGCPLGLLGRAANAGQRMARGVNFRIGRNLRHRGAPPENSGKRRAIVRPAFETSNSCFYSVVYKSSR